jgi:hypothetical protein
MPFLREIGFIPHEIPQKQPYQKIKSDFLKATGLNKNNYKNFTAFNQHLNSFSFSINSTNIDSLISNNEDLKSLYYYSTAYFPWSFAYKKRIRVPLKFSDKSKIEKIKNEKAKNAPIQRIYSNGVFYLNNLSINQDVHVKNATIIFSGRINSIGTKKIKIIGDAASTILFENSNVKLKNVEFIGFGNHIKVLNRAVTSAITFYKSSIELNQVSFSDNYSGDDLVNIFRSSFKLENVKIKNSKFDGIDFDFSTGEIKNSTILNCGNDGLDFGGSQVKVINSSILNCGDKGISIGEKSSIYLSNTSIRNSEIGIGLKDESLAYIRNLKVFKNHLDLAVYGKKGLYDVPILNILQQDFRDLHYLIEPDVRVMNHLNYQPTLQAKKFLYGKKYGKASIR